MEDVKLSKIVVDHFRGYRESKIFDFTNGSDFTILSGSNGFGKTSFFDAVEWGFTGKLFRFEGPNEERSKNHFINYQPYELPAKVTIEFIDKDKKYILKREATNFEERNTDYGANKSTVTLYGPDFQELYDAEAIAKLNDLLIHEDWKGKLEFQNVFSQFHILTQDKLKYFVQGLKGPERYNQISSLLGTSRFQIFNKQVDSIRKEVNDKIKFIDEKLTRMTPEISVLNDRVSNQQSINIEGFSNLKEYINHIIEKYNNTVITGVSIKQIKPLANSEVDEQLISYIKDFIRKISSTLLEIDSSIDNFNNDKKRLDEIYSRKETYLSNKQAIENIRIAIPVIIEKQDLDYLSKNFEGYKEHSLKQEYLKSLLENKSNELSSLTKLINEIEIFNSNLKGQNRNISEILSSNLEVIDKLYNLKSLVNENAQWYKNSSLKTEREFHLILNEMENYFTEFDSFLTRNTLDVEKNSSKRLELEKERNNLEHQNGILTKVDVKYREILKISREHIVTTNHNHKDNIGCPVCGTVFSGDILLEKIDLILSEESEEIRQNTTTIDKITNLIREIDNKNQNAIETLNSYFDKFKNRIDEILDQTGSTLSKYRIDFKNTLSDYKNIEMEFDNNNQLQSNYINIIEKVGFSKVSNELWIDIEQNINRNDKRVESLNIDLNSIDSYRRQLANFEENVRAFDHMLLNLDIKDINADLSSRISSTNNNLSNYYKLRKDLDVSLEKSEKILQSIVRNKDFEKFRELNTLKEKLEMEKKDYLKTISRLANIISSSEKVIEEMNSEILEENGQLINNIYKRIYPHPYFTNIKLELGTNNSGNNILQIKCFKEDQSACEINPAFTFSTAQMNVVAISIFFALALRQKCTRLSTILLDDPIQSMDDVNILSFIDILRSITLEDMSSSLNKQVVMSTHDDKIFRLMSKKLRFLNTQSFRFIDYNEKGPVFESILGRV
ncbi:AAA family ATPase [Bacillus thuringiensis]|nr:AAA family ATPase [Bacillus thuringiensis]